MAIHYAVEKWIRGYSGVEQQLLLLLSAPEIDLSDTDAFLQHVIEIIQSTLKQVVPENHFRFNQWKISHDQRNLILTESVYF